MKMKGAIKVRKHVEKKKYHCPPVFLTEKHSVKYLLYTNVRMNKSLSEPSTKDRKNTIAFYPNS
jgi:hypothetical protein